MSPDTLHEIDWLLSTNLAWALRIEEIAEASGVPIEQMTEFDCVKLLLQLRSAELS